MTVQALGVLLDWILLFNCVCYYSAIQQSYTIIYYLYILYILFDLIFYINDIKNKPINKSNDSWYQFTPGGLLPQVKINEQMFTFIPHNNWMVHYHGHM